MPDGLLKVGELRKTGVSVRTLHHYDDIGLLSPQSHTGSGHRLYTDSDVARLQQIRSLRALGFTLEQVGELLDRADHDPVQIVEMHLARLREQLTAQQQLCGRLQELADGLRMADKETSVDLFLRVLEMMTMVEQYYTPEQLESLKQRREALGEAGMQAAQQQWADLIAAVRGEMEAGTQATDPRVLALAQQWHDLVAAFTGGDPGIRASLDRMYQDKMNQPQAGGDPNAPDRAMFEYMGLAIAALKK